MNWLKNKKNLFIFFRYLIMILSLCYVLYGYIFLPALNRFLPSLMQFCPQNIVGYINNFLIANTASFGLNNPKPLIVALFLFVYTLLFGRAFCAFFCSMGTIQELFGKLGKFIRQKLFHIDDKLNIPAKFDHPLRYIKYVILGCTIFFAWYWGIYLVNITLFNIPFLQVINPWIAIEYLSNPSVLFSVALVAFIAFVIICILCMICERFYCKYLCPAGAMYSLISKISLMRLKKDNVRCSAEKCAQCNMCLTNTDNEDAEKIECKNCNITNASCQLNLDLNNTNRVKTGECIMCGSCYCDETDNTGFNITIFKYKINPLVYMAMAVIIFLGGMTGLRAFGIEKTQYNTEFMLSDYIEYHNQYLKETGYTPITVKDYLASYNLIGVVSEDASMYDFLVSLRNIPFDEFVHIKFENQMTAKKLAKIYQIPKNTDLTQSWETVMSTANASAVVSSEYGDLYMIEGNTSLDELLTNVYPDSGLTANEDMLYAELIPIIDAGIKDSYSNDKVYKETYQPCCVNTSSKKAKK